jgi:hypothetical protein
MPSMNRTHHDQNTTSHSKESTSCKTQQQKLQKSPSSMQRSRGEKHDIAWCWLSEAFQCPIQDFFFWGQRVKGLSANGKKVLMLKNKIIRSQLYFEEDKRKQSWLLFKQRKEKGSQEKKRRERLKRKERTQYFVKIVEIFLLSLVNDNSNLNFETYVLWFVCFVLSFRLEFFF